jgi:hypothetical protein
MTIVYHELKSASAVLVFGGAPPEVIVLYPYSSVVPLFGEFNVAKVLDDLSRGDFVRVVGF